MSEGATQTKLGQAEQNALNSIGMVSGANTMPKSALGNSLGLDMARRKDDIARQRQLEQQADRFRQLAATQQIADALGGTGDSQQSGQGNTVDSTDARQFQFNPDDAQTQMQIAQAVRGNPDSFNPVGQLGSAVLQANAIGDIQQREDKAAQQFNTFLAENPDANLADVSTKAREIGNRFNVPELKKRAVTMQKKLMKQREQAINQSQQLADLAEQTSQQAQDFEISGTDPVQAVSDMQDIITKKQQSLDSRLNDIFPEIPGEVEEEGGGTNFFFANMSKKNFDGSDPSSWVGVSSDTAETLARRWRNVDEQRKQNAIRDAKIVKRLQQAQLDVTRSIGPQERGNQTERSQQNTQTQSQQTTQRTPTPAGDERQLQDIPKQNEQNDERLLPSEFFRRNQRENQESGQSQFGVNVPAEENGQQAEQEDGEFSISLPDTDDLVDAVTTVRNGVFGALSLGEDGPKSASPEQVQNIVDKSLTELGTLSDAKLTAAGVFNEPDGGEIDNEAEDMFRKKSNEFLQQVSEQDEPGLPEEEQRERGKQLHDQALDEVRNVAEEGVLDGLEIQLLYNEMLNMINQRFPGFLRE